MTPSAPFAAGLHTLGHPILPLIRLVQLLYLTGPFATVGEILAELVEPVETNEAVYDHPPRLLKPYLWVLRLFEQLKHPELAPPPSYRIFSGPGEALDPFESLELWVNHQALSQELSTLNSQLCTPCRCHLCCTGPEPGHRQQFFAIPLLDQELEQFPLPLVDTPESRSSSPEAEPPLAAGNGRPFYHGEPALYHWQEGWSLILPPSRDCPNLDRQACGCRIYHQRPSVCRKPQVFPFLLERAPELDRAGEPPAYLAPRKLLAIWDCPYVRQFQEELAIYAQLCGLEPVFKENKG